MEDKIISGLLNSKSCPESIKRLNISMDEYNSLFEVFMKLDPMDQAKAYMISLQSLALQDYLGEMENSVGFCIKQLENRKIQLVDKLIKESKETAITRAEKTANANPDVLRLKDEKAIGEAIYGILDNKIKILDKVYYFCRAMITQPMPGEH